MTAIVTAITSVWTAVYTWLVSSIQSVIPIFWTTDSGGGSLTFLGTLAIIALGISVFFLLVGLVQRFLHFAG